MGKFQLLSGTILHSMIYYDAIMCRVMLLVSLLEKFIYSQYLIIS